MTQLAGPGDRFRHYRNGKEYKVIDGCRVNGSMSELTECVLAFTQGHRLVLLEKTFYEQHEAQYNRWLEKPVWLTDAIAHAAPVIIYESQYDDPKFGEKPLWARPQQMFLGTVQHDGKVVNRFEKIS